MRHLILKYNSFLIYDIKHSLQRFTTKISTNTEKYYSFLKDIINSLKKIEKQNIKQYDKYRFIFIYNKYNFAFQIEFYFNKKSNIFEGLTSTIFLKHEVDLIIKQDKELFIQNIFTHCHYKTLQKAKEHYENGFARFIFPEELQKEMNCCSYTKYAETNEEYFDFDIIKMDN